MVSISKCLDIFPEYLNSQQKGCKRNPSKGRFKRVCEDKFKEIFCKNNDDGVRDDDDDDGMVPDYESNAEMSEEMILEKLNCL